MEDPGYWGARNVFRAAGLQLHPVPVDEDGMAPSETDWSRSPRLVFLSPSNQYPTGAVLSLARRRAILEEAARCGAWIIEDDYDNELRYHKHPLAPLFGLSNSNRVIYLGTFTKVMFPGLRLAYLVVPTGPGGSPVGRPRRTLPRGTPGRAVGAIGIHRRRASRLAHPKNAGRLCGTAGGPAQRHRRSARRSGDGFRRAGGIHLLYFFNEPKSMMTTRWPAMPSPMASSPARCRIYYLEGAHRRRGLMLGYAGVPVEGIRPAAERLAGVIERHAEVRGRAKRHGL